MELLSRILYDGGVKILNPVLEGRGIFSRLIMHVSECFSRIYDEWKLKERNLVIIYCRDGFSDKNNQESSFLSIKQGRRKEFNF